VILPFFFSLPPPSDRAVDNPGSQARVQTHQRRGFPLFFFFSPFLARADSEGCRHAEGLPEAKSTTPAPFLLFSPSRLNFHERREREGTWSRFPPFSSPLSSSSTGDGDVEGYNRSIASE